MLNYWMFPRPIRKLHTIPQEIAIFAEIMMEGEWAKNREQHRAFENALEVGDLKRKGPRREGSGSGGRTHAVLLKALGLTFQQSGTKKTFLTMAGQALADGLSPVPILAHQILKYQFPSAYSTGRNVRVAERFKVRPFVFMFRLLDDIRIGHLTQDEIAKVVLVYADSEKDSCYEDVVRRIQEFRLHGNASLEVGYLEKFGTGKRATRSSDSFGHLSDVANTAINWLEYTQLVGRDPRAKSVYLLEERRTDVILMLAEAKSTPLITTTAGEENFQRKYGLDPLHVRDNRNMTENLDVTRDQIRERRVLSVYAELALKKPIRGVSSPLIEEISRATGFEKSFVEKVLLEKHGAGSLEPFLTNYFSLAFQSREGARDFEAATREIFETVFDFEAEHVGPQPNNPDVYVRAENAGFAGIVDNKAYSHYSISGDHRRVMVHEYIPKYKNLKPDLEFFAYIAGGLGPNINNQLQTVETESGVRGSAFPMPVFLELIRRYPGSEMNHESLRRLFTLGRAVEISDLEE